MNAPTPAPTYGTRRPTLTVRVTLTIEVDRDAYDDEYGVAATASDIRDHVRSEAFAATVSAFDNIDAVVVR